VAIDLENLDAKTGKPQPIPSNAETTRGTEKASVRSAMERVEGIVWRVVAVALLSGWVSYLVRYEVIPIATSDPYTVRYLVKDRWTGRVETVWTNWKGETRKYSREMFSE
jgi:hypothetical protein